MTSFTVSGGSTITTAKTVGGDDTGVVQSLGTLSDTTDITWTGGSTTPGVVITNDGTITATTRGIDTSGSFSTGSIELDNHAGAQFIASGNDAFRVNTNITSGTIKVDNAGLLVSGAVSNGVVVAHSSGQALDFAAVTSATAVIDITNEKGATIGSSGDDAIRPGSGHITIDNDGLIDATASASRAINLNTSTLANLASFDLTNGADGTIQSQGDAVRITATTLATTATYDVTVDNYGTIKSTGATGSNNGQAIDFNDLVSTSGAVHITNEASGKIFAMDADAIRAGQNTTIDNYGHISNNNAAGDSGDDGVDFQSNGGGVVNNHAGGAIDGARHGITGNQAITIGNDGTITGHLGSGVNMDTSSTSTSFVTNTGTITGTGGFLAGVGVDGDGVDIDGLATVKNSGLIQAAGLHVDGELQEAVTIGGGEIDNYAGGTITSFERAITVDDSNGGAAFGATTVYNEGLIHGGNGQAISITGTFADTVTNKGTIDGSIATGGGDDTFNLYTGSSVTGAIDGGDGTDTVNLYGAGVGVVTGLANIEVLNLWGGDWTLGSEGIGAVDFKGAGVLRLEAGLLADHHFDGTIGGLANTDKIDLEGIGLAHTASLGAGNVLTISGGAGGTVTLQLDPDQSFAGYAFELSSDGAGGTDLAIAKVISGGNGGNALTGTAGNDIITGGNGADSINSGDGDDNLSGGNGADVLTAGNGNSTLDGGNGDDVLKVGTGEDVLSGGNGADRFVFGPTFGKDLITDFHNGDHIEFDGAFASFQALQSAMHQTASGDTVIEVDATHEITLAGVSMTSLRASDFIFN